MRKFMAYLQLDAPALGEVALPFSFVARYGVARNETGSLELFQRTHHPTSTSSGRPTLANCVSRNYIVDDDSPCLRQRVHKPASYASSIMRNVLSIAGIGCVAVFILGVIAAGLVMIGYGVKGYLDEKEQTSKPKDPPPAVVVPPVIAPKETRNLLEARRDFKTVAIDNNFNRKDANLQPPPPGAKVVFFDGPAGNLSAYLSKTQPGAAKRPAVIWVHDDFGGIDKDDWQRAQLFHASDFVLMVPSFREENNNAGSFEMFYGEVNDLLAAVDFLAKQPEVDPQRIYVVGHGTGGTLALLASTTGTTKVRSFFAIGGTPDFEEYLRKTNGVGTGKPAPPFDHKRVNEGYLRSPLPFVGAIRKPTYYFGANVNDSEACTQARRMASDPGAQTGPFQAIVIATAKKQDYVQPVNEMIRDQIAQDRLGPISNIRFDERAVNQRFMK